MQPLATDAALSGELRSALARWGGLWNTPGLELRTRVEFSSRMSRTLGLCYPTRGLIRINARVEASPRELLLEILCHEAAHLAAYELHGRGIRPHGREWRRLMVAADYEPRIRFAVQLPPKTRRVRRSFSIRKLQPQIQTHQA